MHVVLTLLVTGVETNATQYKSPAIKSAFMKFMFLLTLSEMNKFNPMFSFF